MKIFPTDKSLRVRNYCDRQEYSLYRCVCLRGILVLVRKQKGYLNILFFLQASFVRQVIALILFHQCEIMLVVIWIVDLDTKIIGGGSYFFSIAFNRGKLGVSDIFKK